MAPGRFKQTIEPVREQFEQRKSLSPEIPAQDNLENRLVSLIEELREKKYLERIVVKTSGRVFFLKTDEIDWIGAAGHYLELHVGRDQSHLSREKMQNIETKLDPNKFLRIHRSVIVNVERIKEMHPMFNGDYAVILRDKTELPLSRNYRDRLQSLLD